MENGISDIDKLLICLAIIIVLTIIWTILVGITYKMYQTKYFYEKLKRYNDGDDFDDDTYDEDYLKDDNDDDDEEDEEDEEDEDEITFKNVYENNESSSYNYENDLKGYYDDDNDDKEEINNIITEKKEPIVKVEKEKETYVKIRFNDSNKIHIFVAPFRKRLLVGEKIKVRIDEDTVKNAVVVKENYTREKYKNKEYDELEIVQE